MTKEEYPDQMDEKTKRRVTYNEDAVLCPGCKKRIRLNNDGRIRIHLSGKVGSGKCMFSGADPLPKESTESFRADNTVSLDVKDSSILDLMTK